MKYMDAGSPRSFDPGTIHRPTPTQVLLAQLRRLAIPVILTAVTACDNVSWAGVDVEVQAPPAASDTLTADTAAAAEEEVLPPLEVGPALFTVERSGQENQLVPVALLDPGGLQALPTDEDIQDFSTRYRRERMSEEQRFVLFAGGDRVGSFYPTGGGGVDSTWCSPRPTVPGRLEVLPEVSDVERFIALPANLGEEYRHDGGGPIDSTRRQREASLSMVAALFMTREIRWPPSVLSARADLQVFRPAGGDTVVAATFLYGDSLAVGEAPPNAYSLFFLGEEADQGFEPSYVRYREVGVDGKGSTRFLDHADWDREGGDNVLLEIFGTERRWFAALEDDGAGGWTEIFEESCGRPGGSDDRTGAEVAAGPGS